MNTNRQVVSNSADIEKIRAYGELHAHSLVASLGRLTRTPVATLMTIVVIAIALALPAGFYVFVRNFQTVAAGFESSNKISFFLNPQVTDEKAETYADRLKYDPAIESLELIPKEKAFEEFKEFSGFGDSLNALESNPLPAVIQIQPVASMDTPAKLRELIFELEASPEADFVQLDMQWVERLKAILATARRGVTLLSVFLSFAVIFIIGNTIRLELQNRKQEIDVTRLLGATNAFIRRPFLYCGFWYGFLASLLAWMLVTFSILVLRGAVVRLAALYGRDYDVLSLGIGDTFYLMVCASVLGVFGAWVVSSYYLAQLNPRK